MVWSSIQIMRGTSSSRWEFTCCAARGNAAWKLPAASFFFTWQLDRWFRETILEYFLNNLWFPYSWIICYVFFCISFCRMLGKQHTKLSTLWWRAQSRCVLGHLNLRFFLRTCEARSGLNSSFVCSLFENSEWNWLHASRCVLFTFFLVVVTDSATTQWSLGRRRSCLSEWLG